MRYAIVVIVISDEHVFVFVALEKAATATKAPAATAGALSSSHINRPYCVDVVFLLALVAASTTSEVESSESNTDQVFWLFVFVVL